jgi:hypothetical protein
MDYHQWGTHKRKQFAEDLKALLDTYGIDVIQNLTAGYYGAKKFQVVTGKAYFRSTRDADKRAVQELLQKLRKDRWMKKVDDALDRRDREAFDLLVGNVPCADCEEPLQDEQWVKCAKCDAKICNKCSQDGNGLCVDCEFEGEDDV